MPLYSDLNQFSPLSSPLVYGYDSILQSLYNIANTRKNERLFSDSSWLDIEDMLFEIYNGIEVDFILNNILLLFEKLEPRVRGVRNLSKIVPVPEKRGFNLSLVFEIREDGKLVEFKDFRSR